MRSGALTCRFIALFMMFGSSQAFATLCSDTCANSDFQVCAHLMVQDIQGSPWIEVCSTPVDSSGQYSFNIPDGRLKSELAKHSSVRVVTRGGASLGQASRQKILSADDIQGVNASVDLDYQSTLDSVGQAMVGDYFALKVIVLQDKLTRFQSFQRRATNAGLFGALEVQSMAALSNNLQGLISTFQALSNDPSSDPALFKQLYAIYGEEIDLHQVGLSEDDSYLNLHSNSGIQSVAYVAESVKVSLIQNYIAMASGWGSDAILRFADVLQTGLADVYPGLTSISDLPDDLKSRVAANQLKLSSSGKVYAYWNLDPELKALFSEIAFEAYRSLTEVQDSIDLGASAYSMLAALCPDGAMVTESNRFSCGFKPAFSDLETQVSIRTVTSLLYGDLAPDAAIVMERFFAGDSIGAVRSQLESELLREQNQSAVLTYFSSGPGTDYSVIASSYRDVLAAANAAFVAATETDLATYSSLVAGANGMTFADPAQVLSNLDSVETMRDGFKQAWVDAYQAQVGAVTDPVLSAYLTNLPTPAMPVSFDF